ncbi:hypothetical protein [Mesorhizobium captivum]|uniref:hypothetical protein n=1 Tax=Mesorhizobium captivum TaxID=3072319 RepID=UPI002A2414A0|nr:hypothetical protein [Mesorhizobium sp. VK3C]MDX8446546.1 hypothetical protein [Mesorhizobium sp. VK3C]
MIISSNLSVKTLEECEPGELVRTLTGGQSLFTLVLTDPIVEQGGRRVVRVGLLEDHDDSRRKYSFLANANRKVISFGTDWALEPIAGDEMRHGNNAANHRSGRLTLSRQGYHLRFSSLPDDPFGDDVIFNLTDTAIVDQVGEDAVPLRGLRIWAKEADVTQQGAGHLLEFNIED